ncbi:MAG: hypothetical protein QOF58_4161 [Pseudonocardiales bacterium]|nr:hypothetical protein [Pseudonocardiales bacterium]
MSMIRTLMAVTTAAVALLGIAPSATAQSTPSVQVSCPHGQGSGIIISSGAVETSAGVRIGTVHLCRDSSYKFWGYLQLDHDLPTGRWGQVTAWRFIGGSDGDSPTTCDGPGGNGYIRPGQSSCYTQKLYGAPGNYKFSAVGRVHNGTYPSGPSHAIGLTEKSR